MREAAPWGTCLRGKDSERQIEAFLNWALESRPKSVVEEKIV